MRSWHSQFACHPLFECLQVALLVVSSQILACLSLLWLLPDQIDHIKMSVQGRDLQWEDRSHSGLQSLILETGLEVCQVVAAMTEMSSNPASLK